MRERDLSAPFASAQIKVRYAIKLLGSRKVEPLEDGPALFVAESPLPPNPRTPNLTRNREAFR